MAKKKKSPWVPALTEPMRFIKILNIEFYDPEISNSIYDVNVLEELKTGEIFLYFYIKGSKIPVGFRLLDKNIGITDLNYEIRDTLRANSGKNLKVFKIIQDSVIDVQFPDLKIGQDDRVNKEQEKTRRISSKDKVTHTNDTAETEKPKPKRKRRSKISEVKGNNSPSSVKRNIKSKAAAKKKATAKKTESKKKPTRKKTISKKKPTRKKTSKTKKQEPKKRNLF